MKATRAAEQNGIKAPQRDGACKQAWDLFDTATADIHAAHMPRLAEQTGLNVENLRIELRRWRKFNGIAVPSRS